MGRRACVSVCTDLMKNLCSWFGLCEGVASLLYRERRFFKRVEMQLVYSKVSISEGSLGAVKKSVLVGFVWVGGRRYVGFVR